MVLLVNLTPHELVLHGGGDEVRLSRDGPPPRAVAHVEVLGAVEARGCAVPLVRTRLDSPEPMPPQVPGTVYVVSRVVAELQRHRDDLVFPDDFLRDADGKILSARRLVTAFGETPAWLAQDLEGD